METEDSRVRPRSSWLAVLIVVALLVGFIRGSIAAQNEVPCAVTIEVAPGDTLSGIAQRTLGSPASYQSIVSATNSRASGDPLYEEIEDANSLSVGQRLCIPPGSGATSQPAGATSQPVGSETVTPAPVREDVEPIRHPLSMTYMRGQDYPGSNIEVIERLQPGSNYRRSVIAYQSEGLTLRALLTVPQGRVPESGWPVIIFNHGYIPPEIYRTAERYGAYVDYFARNGYIVVKPDYRGHGLSEGESSSGHSTPDYTVDVLNAMASIQRYPAADPNRIGFWGHSMGGGITLRSMLIDSDIKAGVVWGGVVVSYPDLLERPALQGVRVPHWFADWRDEFVGRYGSPEENPLLWSEISPNRFVSELSGPIQLHHATADASVPVEYSRVLTDQIGEVGGTVELYEYAGDNHNISANFNTAMSRSLAFFDRHVKAALRRVQ